MGRFLAIASLVFMFFLPIPGSAENALERDERVCLLWSDVLAAASKSADDALAVAEKYNMTPKDPKEKEAYVKNIRQEIPPVIVDVFLRYNFVVHNPAQCPTFPQAP